MESEVLDTIIKSKVYSSDEQNNFGGSYCKTEHKMKC